MNRSLRPKPEQFVETTGHEGHEEALARILERLEKWRNDQENEGDLTVSLSHMTRRGSVGSVVKSFVFSLSDHLEPTAEALLADAVSFGETLRAGRTVFKLAVEDRPKLGSATFTIAFANENDDIAQDVANGPIQQEQLLSQAYRHLEFALREMRVVSTERAEDLRERVRAAEQRADKLLEIDWKNRELYGELTENAWQRRRADKLDQLKEKGLETAGKSLMSLALVYATQKAPQLEPAIRMLLGQGAEGGAPMLGAPEPVVAEGPAVPAAVAASGAPPASLEEALKATSDQDLEKQVQELEAITGAIREERERRKR